MNVCTICGQRFDSTPARRPDGMPICGSCHGWIRLGRADGAERLAAMEAAIAAARAVVASADDGAGLVGYLYADAADLAALRDALARLDGRGREDGDAAE